MARCELCAGYGVVCEDGKAPPEWQGMVFQGKQGRIATIWGNGKTEKGFRSLPVAMCPIKLGQRTPDEYLPGLRDSVREQNDTE